ncbi:dihydroorotase [Flavobacterium gawalongense]|uniref:Dihydroorotase n=1 Tax=Flavobacterium gawalongense TaxID=2594432 RepID=A0A553BR45_9FLAO|nr:dihydroorotase [Flavobacterium gawalongense]TRX03383.1 dihydroorotase [Flavobacterium gawalongense]TRX06849.1 dihydroorotase [Flavobacterium gawalongense]TRX10732.1 dihydroorotase [Flavobacterium gawalongense]TRX11455.1 dihydroorotase [Flavobacterium gawalongense]TRX29224.1 dihydroorotase [Flavobacterium gawalongense]
MNIIIREAKIIDSKSPFHNKTVDILIVDGFIKKIGRSLPNLEKADEVKLDNLHVSQGWFDSSVSLGEPGFEDRETISNGLAVAAKSGFTAIALQPNSFPIIDNQSQVNFVVNKAHGFATQLFPIGALTKQSEGKDMAELYDMKKAGAIAFGDYNKSLDNANLLKIALQYVQDFDGLVIAFAQDENIKGNGAANEGVISTRLGLKGIPNLAEELQIARNLFLLEYTGGKLHIPTLSTKKSVQLIKEAKANGLNVTCSVAVHHLVLTDEKLEGFDTRYKVSPPLRTETDRKALLKGIKDGTIDMITSDHNPIDIEHKKMEFDTAKNGTIGLESAFGALMTVLPLETVIEKLTAGKSTFGIDVQTINEGSKANITLFNPEPKSIFTKSSILSKSKNSAFLGTEIKGKVHGILNQGKLILV